MLHCTGLSKRYGRKLALDAVNLELNTGSPVALIGPNGAGKTTLLSLLCGYTRPTRGEVRIFGEIPGSASLLGRLAALPQDAALDPRFAVIRQLSFYAALQGISGRQAKAESERVLGLVQLTDAAARKPAQLSHGMRKRVVIAQALLGSPELVLLDEPTAGLDPPNVKIIRDLITELSGRITFIVSSHNLDELERVCSRVLHLENGRMKEQTHIDATETEGYLTINLVRVDSQTFIESLNSLAGVKDVSQRQQGDFVLAYDFETHPDLDQHLLKHLAVRNWQYKRLIKGRTLEDKLFF